MANKTKTINGVSYEIGEINDKDISFDFVYEVIDDLCNCHIVNESEDAVLAYKGDELISVMKFSHSLCVLCDDNEVLSAVLNELVSAFNSSGENLYTATIVDDRIYFVVNE